MRNELHCVSAVALRPLSGTSTTVAAAIAWRDVFVRFLKHNVLGDRIICSARHSFSSYMMKRDGMRFRAVPTIFCCLFTKSFFFIFHSASYSSADFLRYRTNIHEQIDSWFIGIVQRNGRISIYMYLRRFLLLFRCFEEIAIESHIACFCDALNCSQTYHLALFSRVNVFWLVNTFSFFFSKKFNGTVFCVSSLFGFDSPVLFPQFHHDGAGFKDFS
jgi:hypothetical protein